MDKLVTSLLFVMNMTFGVMMITVNPILSGINFGVAGLLFAQLIMQLKGN